MRLRVTEVCRDSRVFRKDGERLRRAIQEAWTSDPVCIVDFENLRIASVSFLDEAIAVLALEMSPEEMKTRLEVENLTPQDAHLLEELTSTRSIQRASA